ncbi:YceI family protein [Streptosporangiaceae bacterium NEAU-GS5]|nr:YceI family protein [Streptosporangiaceae bacterium NEAU-GS5]
MTATAQTPRSAPNRRKRHWLRWILAGVLVVVVLAWAAVAAALKLQPTPAPLALPASVAAPAGPLDGTWRISSGSVAGFRVQQTVLAMSSDVVGRTGDVTGTVVIAGGQVTNADLRIGLLTLTSGKGKAAPQFGISLDTRNHPDATVALARPAALGGPFASGAAITVTASGRLTLHGVTRPVTAPLSARRDGAAIAIAGSIPVTFADWGIAQPEGYGLLGSLADRGVAEFLLILRRA